MKRERERKKETHTMRKEGNSLTDKQTDRQRYNQTDGGRQWGESPQSEGDGEKERKRRRQKAKGKCTDGQAGRQ